MYAARNAYAMLYGAVSSIIVIFIVLLILEGNPSYGLCHALSWPCHAFLGGPACWSAGLNSPN